MNLLLETRQPALIFPTL